MSLIQAENLFFKSSSNVLSLILISSFKQYKPQLLLEIKEKRLKIELGTRKQRKTSSLVLRISHDSRGDTYIDQ